MRRLLLTPFIILVIFPNDLLAKSCKSLLESKGWYSAYETKMIKHEYFVAYSKNKIFDMKDIRRCNQPDIDVIYSNVHDTHAVGKVSCEGKKLYYWHGRGADHGCLYSDNPKGDKNCFHTEPAVLTTSDQEECKQINSNQYEEDFYDVDSAYSATANIWFHIIRFRTRRYTLPPKFKPPSF